MTINVGIVTAEGLIFGCDSIASTTKYLLDPFKLDHTDDGSGNFDLNFNYGDLEVQTTNVWSGVTKMFPISAGSSPVSAVTAGLARLQGRTMSSLANEFLTGDKKNKPRSVKAISERFLAFLHKEYEEQYKSSTLPENLRDGPEFLVGGYGYRDKFASLYKIKVMENTVTPLYNKGEFGVAWAGQSDAVERLIHGSDNPVRQMVEGCVEKCLRDYHDAMVTRMTEILQQLLDHFGKSLPDGIDTTLPVLPNGPDLQWQKYGLDLTVSNLPLQDAVDFAAFLVNMQSGKAKFVNGVATVGGYTHIGVVTKAEGFRMIREPELKHENTGFSHDF